MVERAREYCIERDAVLRRLNAQEYIQFALRHAMPLPPSFYSQPLEVSSVILLASMHKARLQINAFTPDEKLASATWLTANNYSLPEPLRLEDGVLIGAEYEH